MSRARLSALALLIISVTAGSLADRPESGPPLMLGGYRVIAADFHTHSSWSNGGLTPWGLVLEAKRQGLDAIAITGHNKVSDSKAGRWFGRIAGGPTVLTGQEIQTARTHVIAVGIEDPVDWRRDVAGQIEAVHRQGGVAIAAHPVKDFWPGFDQTALERLDGAEICHPVVFDRGEAAGELEDFAARAPLAAIGSSDFHGVGRIGICRTYVFARDDSAEAIIAALREHRTVVYGPGGRAYGDPSLIALAETHPRLRARAVEGAPPGWMDWLSRACGLAGLIALLVFPRAQVRPRADDQERSP